MNTIIVMQTGTPQRLPERMNDPPSTVWFVARNVKQAILYSKLKLKDKDIDVFISEKITVARNGTLTQLKKKTTFVS